jgi:predicted nucleic acid-binding protein
VVLTYVDSSVALAHLFAEPRQPRPEIWDRQLASSRLLEYEICTRIHLRRPALAGSASLRALLTGTALIELSRPVLLRALDPWPVPLRTLDALHLATMDYLRRQGESVELASYDRRLISAAAALGIAIAAL